MIITESLINYRYYFFKILNHTCTPFRVIKLTSPNLNYVMILGAFLLIFGNVFGATVSQNNPSTLPVFCEVGDIVNYLLSLISSLSILIFFFISS